MSLMPLPEEDQTAKDGLALLQHLSVEQQEREAAAAAAAASSSPPLDLPAARPPHRRIMTPANSNMQKTRIFMSQMMGALSPEMFGRIQVLDGSDEMCEAIRALDETPARDQHVVWLVFARNLVVQKDTEAAAAVAASKEPESERKDESSDEEGDETVQEGDKLKIVKPGSTKFGEICEVVNPDWNGLVKVSFLTGPDEGQVRSYLAEDLLKIKVSKGWWTEPRAETFPKPTFPRLPLVKSLSSS